MDEKNEKIAPMILKILMYTSSIIQKQPFETRSGTSSGDLDIRFQTRESNRVTDSRYRTKSRTIRFSFNLYHSTLLHFVYYAKRLLPCKLYRSSSCLWCKVRRERRTVFSEVQINGVLSLLLRTLGWRGIRSFVLCPLQFSFVL